MLVPFIAIVGGIFIIIERLPPSLTSIAIYTLISTLPLALISKLAASIFRFFKVRASITPGPNQRIESRWDVVTVALHRILSWTLKDRGNRNNFQLLRPLMSNVLTITTFLARLRGAIMVHVTAKATHHSHKDIEGYWIVEHTEHIPSFNSKKLLSKTSSFFSTPPKIEYSRLNYENLEKTSEDVLFVLYIHGGGYCINDARIGLEHHHELVKRFNKADKSRKLVIFAVEYPLSPEHPFPAALNASLIAFEWLVKDIGAKSIFIGGDSAGGNCAITLANSIVHSQPHLKKHLLGTLLFSPWVDPGVTIPPDPDFKDVLNISVCHYWASCFANTFSLCDPRIAPVYCATEKDMAFMIHSLGTFVVYGSIEMGARSIELFVSNMEKMKRELKEQGKITGGEVVVHVGKDMMHDYNVMMLHAYGITRDAGLVAIDETVAFLMRMSVPK